MKINKELETELFKLFKPVVLSHIVNSMSDSEYQTLRNYTKTWCEAGSNLIEHEDYKERTKEQIVDNGLMSSYMDSGFISQDWDLEEIGRVKDIPCFYCNGRGYYFVHDEKSGIVIDLMVTWPAYPIGW